jgi:hypothetical protein
MLFRAAIALIALAAPAIAQHGGARGGSFGNRGFAGHAGFSGHAGISRPGGFARPAQPVRYGALGGAGFRGIGSPSNSRFRIPYNGNRFMAAPRLARDAGQSRTWNGDEDRNRAAFDARRRSFEHWYVNTYPAWLGYSYPYLIDPWFSNDWDDFDNSANDTGYDTGGAAPEYPSPYPDEGYGALSEQPSAAAPAALFSPEPEQPLTVIFKSGRAPVKVQNYMMTAKVLTDLDSQHYEEIPVDQIDLAATQQVNSAAGVEFQIPGASRD